MYLYFSAFRNLALNRPAYQTDTFIAGTPEKAVDGNLEQVHNNKMCAHSYSYNSSWEVDLGRMYSIDHVIIYNRLDTCCGRLMKKLITTYVRSCDITRDVSRGQIHETRR